MNKLFLLLFVCFLVGCESKHPGFHEISEDLWRKVFVIGEEDRPVKQGDVVKINMQFTTTDGKEIMSAQNVYMSINNTDDTDMQEAMAHLVLGDSATYILKRPNSFENDSVTDVYFSVRINDIISQAAYEQMVSDYIIRSEKKETEEIFGYLEKTKSENWQNWQSLYFKTIKSGKGMPITKGNKVSIHYVGKMLNGKVFDSTYETNDPLYFVFGDPGQVIEGFERILWKMRKGGKSKIILPSYLAFGEQGSATGIVPPFTPVLYEIEVIENFK